MHIRGNARVPKGTLKMSADFHRVPKNARDFCWKSSRIFFESIRISLYIRGNAQVPLKGLFGCPAGSAAFQGTLWVYASQMYDIINPMHPIDTQKIERTIETIGYNAQ
jgi:hypothetical protein